MRAGQGGLSLAWKSCVCQSQPDKLTFPPPTHTCSMAVLFLAACARPLAQLPASAPPISAAAAASAAQAPHAQLAAGAEPVAASTEAPATAPSTVAAAAVAPAMEAFRGDTWRVAKSVPDSARWVDGVSRL